MTTMQGNPYDYTASSVAAYEKQASQLYLASSAGYNQAPNPQMVNEAIRTGLSSALSGLYAQGQPGYQSLLTGSPAGQRLQAPSIPAISSALAKQPPQFSNIYTFDPNDKALHNLGDDQSLVALGTNPIPNVGYLGSLAKLGKDDVLKYQTFLGHHGFLQQKQFSGSWDPDTQTAMIQYMAARYLPDALYKSGQPEGINAAAFLGTLGYNVNDIITSTHGDAQMQKQTFLNWLGTQDPTRQRDSIGSYLTNYGQNSIPDSIKQFQPTFTDNAEDGVVGLIGGLVGWLPVVGGTLDSAVRHVAAPLENLLGPLVQLKNPFSRMHGPFDLFEDARQVRANDLLSQFQGADKEALMGVVAQSQNAMGFLAPLQDYETKLHEALFGAVYNTTQLFNGDHQYQNPFDSSTKLGAYALVHNGDWVSFLGGGDPTSPMYTPGGSFDHVLTMIANAPVVGGTINLALNLGLDPLTYTGVGKIATFGGKGLMLADRTIGRSSMSMVGRTGQMVTNYVAEHPHFMVRAIGQTMIGADRIVGRGSSTAFGNFLSVQVAGGNFWRDRVFRSAIDKVNRDAPMLTAIPERIVSNQHALDQYDQLSLEVQQATERLSEYDTETRKRLEFVAGTVKTKVYKDALEAELVARKLDRPPTLRETDWHLNSQPGTSVLHGQDLSESEVKRVEQILKDNKFYSMPKFDQEHEDLAAIRQAVLHDPTLQGSYHALMGEFFDSAHFDGVSTRYYGVKAGAHGVKDANLEVLNGHFQGITDDLAAAGLDAGEIDEVSRRLEKLRSDHVLLSERGPVTPEEAQQIRDLLFNSLPPLSAGARRVLDKHLSPRMTKRKQVGETKAGKPLYKETEVSIGVGKERNPIMDEIGNIRTRNATHVEPGDQALKALRTEIFGDDIHDRTEGPLFDRERDLLRSMQDRIDEMRKEQAHLRAMNATAFLEQQKAEWLASQASLREYAEAEILASRAVQDYETHPAMRDGQHYVTQALREAGAEGYDKVVSYRQIVEFERTRRKQEAAAAEGETIGPHRLTPEDVAKIRQGITIMEKQAAEATGREAAAIRRQIGVLRVRIKDFGEQPPGYAGEGINYEPPPTLMQRRARPDVVYVGKYRRFGDTFWHNPHDWRDYQKADPTLSNDEARMEAMVAYAQFVLTNPRMRAKLPSLVGKRFAVHEPTKINEGHVLAKLAQDSVRRPEKQPVRLLISGDRHWGEHAPQDEVLLKQQRDLRRQYAQAKDVLEGLKRGWTEKTTPKTTPPVSAEGPTPLPAATQDEIQAQLMKVADVGQQLGAVNKAIAKAINRDRLAMLAVMSRLPRGSTVIHGDAKGADKMAADIAANELKGLHLKVIAEPARWDDNRKVLPPVTLDTLKEKRTISERAPTQAEQGTFGVSGFQKLGVHPTEKAALRKTGLRLFEKMDSAISKARAELHGAAPRQVEELGLGRRAQARAREKREEIEARAAGKAPVKQSLYEVLLRHFRTTPGAIQELEATAGRRFETGDKEMDAALEKVRPQLVADYERKARAATVDKSQGHLRNRRMLEKHKPTHAALFHRNIEQSKGTKNMLEHIKGSGAVPWRVFDDVPDWEQEREATRQVRTDQIQAQWRQERDRFLDAHPAHYVEQQQARILAERLGGRPPEPPPPPGGDRPHPVWDDGPYRQVVNGAGLDLALDKTQRRSAEIAAVLIQKDKVGLDEAMKILLLGDDDESVRIAAEIQDSGNAGRALQIMQANLLMHSDPTHLAMQNLALQGLTAVAEAKVETSRAHRWLVAGGHAMINTQVDFKNRAQVADMVRNLTSAVRMPVEEINRLTRGIIATKTPIALQSILIDNVFPAIHRHFETDAKLKELGGWAAFQESKAAAIPEGERPADLVAYAVDPSAKTDPALREDVSRVAASTGNIFRDHQLATWRASLKELEDEFRASFVKILAGTLHAVPDAAAYDVDKAIAYIENEKLPAGLSMLEKFRGTRQAILDAIAKEQPRGGDGMRSGPITETQHQWKGYLPFSPYEALVWQHKGLHWSEKAQEALRINRMNSIWKGIVLTHPATSLRITLGDEVGRYVMWMLTHGMVREAAHYIGVLMVGMPAQVARKTAGLLKKDIPGWATQKEFDPQVSFNAISAFHLLKQDGVTVYHPKAQNYDRALGHFFENTLGKSKLAKDWMAHHARDLDIRDLMDEAEVLHKQDDWVGASQALDDATALLEKRGLVEAHAELHRVYNQYLKDVKAMRDEGTYSQEGVAAPNYSSVFSHLTDVPHGEEMKELLRSADSGDHQKAREMMVAGGHDDALQLFDLARTEFHTYVRKPAFDLSAAKRSLVTDSREKGIQALIDTVKAPFVQEGQPIKDPATGEERPATKEDVAHALAMREHRRIHRLYTDRRSKDAVDHRRALRDQIYEVFVAQSRELERMAKDPKTKGGDYRALERSGKGTLKEQAYRKAAELRDRAKALEMDDQASIDEFHDKTFRSWAEQLDQLLGAYTAHPLLARALHEGTMDRGKLQKLMKGDRYNPETMLPVIVAPIASLDHARNLSGGIQKVFNWYHENVTQSMVNYARGSGLIRMTESLKDKLAAQYGRQRDDPLIMKRAHDASIAWMKSMTYQGQRSVLAHAVRNIFPFWGATANMSRYWVRLLADRTGPHGVINPTVPFLNFMNSVQTAHQQGGYNIQLPGFLGHMMGFMGMGNGDSLTIDPSAAWFVTTDGIGGFFPGFGPIFSYGLDYASSMDPNLAEEIKKIPVIGPVYGEHIHATGFNPLLGWAGQMVTGAYEATTGRMLPQIPFVSEPKDVEQKAIDDKTRQMAALAMEEGRPMPTTEEATRAHGRGEFTRGTMATVLPLNPKIVDQRKTLIAKAQKEWDSATTGAEQDKVIAANPEVAPLLQYYDRRTPSTAKNELVLQHPWVAAYATSEYVHPGVAFSPNRQEFTANVNAGNVILENPKDYLRKVQDTYLINQGELQYSALKAEEENFLQQTGAASTSAIAKAYRMNTYYPILNAITANNEPFANLIAKNWGKDPVSRYTETRPLRSLMAYEVIPQADNLHSDKTHFWQQALLFVQQATTGIADLEHNGGTAAQKRDVSQALKDRLVQLADQNPEFAAELDSFHFGRVEDLVMAEAGL